MRLVVSQFNYWCRLQAQSEAPFFTHTHAFQAKAPVLEWVPAMQRRRLSDFAKMALHVAQQAASHAQSAHLPVIYASRHGDFHRTSKILKDLAAGEALSPTSFGLSVHNAVVGLYSILTNNQAPMTTISAGTNTVLMALIEAYSQLVANQLDEVLLVYCDQALPDEYKKYERSPELDLSFACILRLEGDGSVLNITPQQDVAQSVDADSQNMLICQLLSGEYADLQVGIVANQGARWQLSFSGTASC